MVKNLIALTNAPMVKDVVVNLQTRFTNSLSKKMNSVEQIIILKWSKLLVTISPLLSFHTLKPI
jgi:hypothetical protein